ncbi:MAG: apolipoprotein N-acyltransferase [Candidatus Omnitrophica bacterium]|nr:apolipoprotein N-acyltransferase [Candidatus Omnitrophota bacterium]
MRKSFQLSAFSFQLLLILTSSLFLVLSFPNFNYEFLAWIALVPLFFAIDNQKPFKAFVLSYLCGLLFFLGTVYWLIHVTLPGMIIVALYLALYFGFFGALCSYFLRTTQNAQRTTSHYFTLIAIPSTWVALELARSRFLTGFGWNLLAHSQSYTLPVIQIADITGVYGVSFLIVMVNAGIFLTVKNLRKKNYSLAYLTVAIFIVYISVAYGTYRLKNIFTGEGLRVAVIQGNIPQVKKWDVNFRGDILSKYEKLTREAAREKVDLVIWPETSVPGFLETERDLFERIRNLTREIKTPLLVGAPREGRGPKEAYYNSTYLFGDDGRLLDRYDKIHLVPFGEYVPAKDIFSFVENFAPSPIGDFTAGNNYTVFKFSIERNTENYKLKWKLIRKVKFSTLVCFEDIFPDLAREFVRRGAEVLVNMTNDAWFGRSSAAYQHAQSSVFRAVENRVNVVRAANTGLSCFIDQKGRITAAVGPPGNEIFTDGYKIHDLVLTKTRTFYTVYGDLFAYLCVIIAVLCFLILKQYRRKKDIWKIT